MSDTRSQWVSSAYHAAEAIGKDIVKGKLIEGSKLPLEAELAKKLNVSRNTLREAIKLLAAKNILKVAPRRGTIVLPRNQWSVLDEDVLTWSGSDLVTDKRFNEELIRIRTIIEPAAAFDAAIIGHQEQIDKIQIAFRRMEETALSERPSASVETDVAFHLAIAEAANNRFILSITRSIVHALRANFQLLDQDPKHIKGNLENHRNVYEAISRRDSGAAKRSMEHLIQRNKDDSDKLAALKVLPKN